MPVMNSNILSGIYQQIFPRLQYEYTENNKKRLILAESGVAVVFPYPQDD